MSGPRSDGECWPVFEGGMEEGIGWDAAQSHPFSPGGTLVGQVPPTFLRPVPGSLSHSRYRHQPPPPPRPFSHSFGSSLPNWRSPRPHSHNFFDLPLPGQLQAQGPPRGSPADMAYLNARGISSSLPPTVSEWARDSTIFTAARGAPFPNKTHKTTLERREDYFFGSFEKELEGLTLGDSAPPRVRVFHPPPAEQTPTKGDHDRPRGEGGGAPRRLTFTGPPLGITHDLLTGTESQNSGGGTVGSEQHRGMTEQLRGVLGQESLPQIGQDLMLTSSPKKKKTKGPSFGDFIPPQMFRHSAGRDITSSAASVSSEGQGPCAFCLNTCRSKCEDEGRPFVYEDEAPMFSHDMHSPYSKRTTCPELRQHKCQRCGATGDRAHTKRHCKKASPAKYPPLS